LVSCYWGIEGLRPKYFFYYVGINDAGFRFDGSNSDKSLDNGLLRKWLRKSVIVNLFKQVLDVLFKKKDNAYAGHIINGFKDTNYSALNNTPGVDGLVKANTQKFKLRFDKLMSETIK